MSTWDDMGTDFVSANERSQSSDSSWLRVRGKGVKTVGTGGKGASSPDPAENSGCLRTDGSLVEDKRKLRRCRACRTLCML